MLQWWGKKFKCFHFLNFGNDKNKNTFQSYGMTEMGTVAKSLAFAKNPFKIKSGSCGTVIRNAEMKVVDTITGVSLPHNKPGEICIRGDQLMKGKTKFNDSC